MAFSVDDFKAMIAQNADATKTPIGVAPGYKATRANPTAGKVVPAARPAGTENFMGPVAGAGPANPSPMMSAAMLDPYARELQNRTRQVEPDTIQVAARYFEGMQYDQFAGMNPADLLVLQHKMKDAGVLKKNYKVKNVWDPEAQEAMATLMMIGNQSGQTWEEVMAQWKQTVPDEEHVGKTLQLKSPEEIGALLDETAAKAIGRSLSPAERNALVRGYQDIDRSSQEAEAAAKAVATEGGSSEYTDPISAETYADQQIRKQFKGEADRVTGEARMKEFYSILGEGAGMGGFSG